MVEKQKIMVSKITGTQCNNLRQLQNTIIRKRQPDSSNVCITISGITTVVPVSLHKTMV